MPTWHHLCSLSQQLVKMELFFTRLLIRNFVLPCFLSFFYLDFNSIVAMYRFHFIVYCILIMLGFLMLCKPFWDSLQTMKGVGITQRNK